MPVQLGGDFALQAAPGLDQALPGRKSPGPRAPPNPPGLSLLRASIEVAVLLVKITYRGKPTHFDPHTTVH